MQGFGVFVALQACRSIFLYIRFRPLSVVDFCRIVKENGYEIGVLYAFKMSRIYSFTKKGLHKVSPFYVTYSFPLQSCPDSARVMPPYGG